MTREVLIALLSRRFFVFLNGNYNPKHKRNTAVENAIKKREKGKQISVVKSVDLEAMCESIVMLITNPGCLATRNDVKQLALLDQKCL